MWSRCFHKWQRAVTLHYGQILTLSMSPLIRNVFPQVSLFVDADLLEFMMWTTSERGSQMKMDQAAPCPEAA